jgi:hypothetical protein
LLGLIGVGLGTGISYHCDRADKENQEAYGVANDAISRKKRELAMYRSALLRARDKVNKKLDMTRSLLGSLHK